MRLRRKKRKIISGKGTQEFICVACPIGCMLTVKVKGREVRSVTGNRCSKGPLYAAQEVAGPRRVVTTTVRLHGGRIPLLPVKTRVAVPRDSARAVVIAASSVVVSAPVDLGDVVLPDVAGTGVDLVATRSVEPATEGQ